MSCFFRDAGIYIGIYGWTIPRDDAATSQFLYVNSWGHSLVNPIGL